MKTNPVRLLLATAIALSSTVAGPPRIKAIEDERVLRICSEDGIVHSDLFDTLNNVIAHIGLAPCTVYIHRPVRADADLTVPENVLLRFAPGGSLIPDVSVNVTIEGAIDAAETQVVFDMRAGTFSVKWSGELVANWWSGSDMGERVNNLLISVDFSVPGALDRTVSVRIVGDAVVSTPINMTNLRPTGGLVVTMTGRLLCRLRGDQPAIDLVGSRGIKAINWSLYGDPRDPPSVGVLSARARNERVEHGDTIVGVPRSAGNHQFVNLTINGGWTVAPIYLIDSEDNYFQNLRVATAGGRYGFFFGGTNVDTVRSPHVPIDDSSSQTDLHIDGLYMRARDVSHGAFYVSGADRVHLSGMTFIFANASPKIVLDMNVAGILGFWVDGLHAEGRPDSLFSVSTDTGADLDNGRLGGTLEAKFRAHGVPLSPDATVSIVAPAQTWLVIDGGKPVYHLLREHDPSAVTLIRIYPADDAIRVSGPGRRLSNAFVRSLGLGVRTNAIHIEKTGTGTGALRITDSRFQFVDAATFRNTGKIIMERNVEIVTRGDEDAPAIILGQGNFNGEIWGGDIEKLSPPSGIMAGQYYDGVSGVMYDFQRWPVDTLADGDPHPSIAGGRRFAAFNERPTEIRNFADAHAGQEIDIIFLDAHTTIHNGPNIRLKNDRPFTGSKGDMITLIKMDRGFTEKSRSLNHPLRP